MKHSHLFKFTVNSVPTTYVVLVAFSVSIVSDRRGTMIFEDASFFQSEFNNLPLTFLFTWDVVSESLLVEQRQVYV